MIAARRDREFTPTLIALREIQAQSETDGTDPEVKTRLAETIEVMQQLDGWYESIASLPRETQLTLLKTGAKIGDLLGSSPTADKPKKKKKKKKSEPES